MGRLAAAGLLVAALAVNTAGCGGSGGGKTASGRSTTAARSTTAGPSATVRSVTSSAPAATVTPPSVTTTTSAGSPGTGVARAALHVAPSTGYRTSVFKFGFRAPAASGTREGVHSAYSLSVAGPSGSGCVSTHSLALPTVAQGAPVTVDVGPAQLGGDWCAGDWSARVAEVAGPRCAQGQACPQFLRLVAIVGPVSFRVAAAAAG